MILVGFLGLAFAGCQTSNGLDLGKNTELYSSPGYRSKLPGDRAVFVAPLRDERNANPPSEEGPYPIRYMSDRVWERPLAEMVNEILIEELNQSKVFREILSRPTSESLVLMPSLVQMRGGQQEMVEGARSLVVIAIRVQIHGPANENGDRALLLDQTYSDRQGSPVSFRPPTIVSLTGVSLRYTMANLVSGLDQSNVARSGVPLEAIGKKR